LFDPNDTRSYDKALAIRPGYADALNNRGNALRDFKRLEEALASYDKALAIRPDHPEALNNRGIACLTTAAARSETSSDSRRRWPATTRRSPSGPTPPTRSSIVG
jgi:tetratricopeptide (TPR) repeat protein